MKSSLRCHGNKVIFFPVAKKKRSLKQVAVPFFHEGVTHATYSVTFICQDAPEALEVV